VAATTTERPRRPGPTGLGLWSLGAFFAVLAVLAVQVRAGEDPALGPAKPAADVAQRRVIVHRVVLRRVVVTEPAPRASVPASGGGSAPATPAPPVPAAPVASAPAPAAPAPAPAPAPVTTGAS
jgi:hypothetical protein